MEGRGVTGEELCAIARPGMGLLIEPRTVGDREEWSISVPAPPSKEGDLWLALVVSAMKPLPGLPNPQLRVRIVMQWLEPDKPITIAQSHISKQDFRFARHLEPSMREETLAYVGQLVADNRPAGELIVSDWTMMNDALARHYGYAPLDGGHLRKVKLKADDPRGGGILGQAGIQSILCWTGENWVIYRGGENPYTAPAASCVTFSLPNEFRICTS